MVASGCTPASSEEVVAGGRTAAEVHASSNMYMERRVEKNNLGDLALVFLALVFLALTSSTSQVHSYKMGTLIASFNFMPLGVYIKGAGYIQAGYHAELFEVGPLVHEVIIATVVVVKLSTQANYTLHAELSGESVVVFKVGTQANYTLHEELSAEIKTFGPGYQYELHVEFGPFVHVSTMHDSSFVHVSTLYDELSVERATVVFGKVSIQAKAKYTLHTFGPFVYEFIRGVVGGFKVGDQAHTMSAYRDDFIAEIKVVGPRRHERMLDAERRLVLLHLVRHTEPGNGIF